MIVTSFYSTCKSTRRVKVVYTLKHYRDREYQRWFTDEHHARKWLVDVQRTHDLRSYIIQRVGV